MRLIPLICTTWAILVVAASAHDVSPQSLARVYALVAGEIARDPAAAASRLKLAAEEQMKTGAFNELSPQCGPVFASMVSTVLAVVLGGVEIPEYMEFIKWLDSIAKPEAGILNGNVNWIGSREECEGLRLPVYYDPNNVTSRLFVTTGRYCSFQVNQSWSIGFSSGDIGKQLKSSLQLAMCLPNPCVGQDAEIAVNFVIKTVLDFVGPILQGIPGLGGILNALKTFSLVGKGCAVTSAEAGSSLHFGAIFMIAITCILVAIILLATVSTAYMKCKGVRQNDRFYRICKAFCLRTNLTKLFAPPSEDALTCLNGIRVLSMFWVILGHSLLLFVYMIDNPVKLLDDFRKRWQSVIILNATTSVDSFFLLSGALVAYGFFRRFGNGGRSGETKTAAGGLKRPGFWLLFYFHRFWRLTPVLIFFLHWQTALIRYLGDGALFPKNRVMLDTASCEKNWWTLLLYVQNFVRVPESCMGHMWYLANDMQMYMASPVLLLPFFFGGIKIGTAISVAVVIISMICSGVLNSVYGFKYGTLNFVPGQQDGYYPGISYYEIVYIKPYCRMGAYAIGIILGYILATKKSIRLPKVVVLLGWLIAATGGLAFLYLVQPQIAGTGDPLTVPQATTYWTFVRPGFAFCVAWVVFACVYGYGGPVNRLLSWSWFAPLGRLTYCAYVIHICVIYMFYVTYDAKFHLSDTALIMTFLSNLMATYLASLVLSMLLEAPLLGLEKALLSGQSGSRPQAVKPVEEAKDEMETGEAQLDLPMSDVNGSQQQQQPQEKGEGNDYA